MIQTVKCKLSPTNQEAESLSRTLNRFADACNLALKAAIEHDKRRAYDIHHLCYHNIKATTSLTANYVVRAIARVAQSFGKRKRPPQKFNPTSLDLDHNLFRFNPVWETVSIASLDGRLKNVKLSLGNYQRNLLKNRKLTSGNLIYEKNKNQFYLCFYINVETPKPGGDFPLGVDRGINRIATTSDGFIKSGKTLNYLRRRTQKTVASLQRKKAEGTKNNRRNNVYKVLKRLSGKIQRLQTNTNHTLSKQIVQRAKKSNSFIVLETLEGIQKRCGSGKRLRKLLGGWAFYQLQTFIEYKSAIEGVEVKYINPAFTSKTCPECLNLGSRKKHKFSCSQCGYVGDSDLVGALNIARLGSQVSQPEVVDSNYKSSNLF